MAERNYLTLNRFLKERFGSRVQKIPLDAGLGCPNRKPDGSAGCIFCDSRGSGTGAHKQGKSVREQMEAGMIWASKRYGAKKFIAYFQSWSNTFASPESLRQIFSEALIDESVVGISIGTRPDCIDRSRLDVIAQVGGKRMVWMEYGLQSASDKTLRLINRGHLVEDFVKAVKLTHEYDFLLCAHVMFGLPEESRDDMEKTVELLKETGVEGVKFHQLFVVNGTGLHKMYDEGLFNPISLEDYASITAWSIKRLGCDTVIQRIVGDPPKGELVAPLWSMNKKVVVDAIHKQLDIV